MPPRRPKNPPTPEPAARDWPVAALAAAAAAISIYLAALKLAGGTALFCEAGSGCDVVQASKWATLLGVPTAAWGAALYVALVALALAGLAPKRWIWAFALASSAVAFSAYVTAISIFQIGATCPWCLAVAALALAILVTLLVRRPASTGRRSMTRPARVVIVGIAAAVVTVAFAAGVWVTETSTAAGGFADGLARHLAATDGIMYGAFW
jgi:uncharacterized membrane protein